LRSLLVRVVELAGNQREGGSTLAVRSSRGEPKTSGRTQRERDEDRENARTRQETRGENKKSARATRWKTRGDLLFCLGVARVHLIYQTLRNAEGTTPKLNRYPSEAPALQRALRPHVASCNAPALRPYELQRVPTSCDVSLRRCDVSLRCCDVSSRCCDVRQVLTGFEGCHRTRDSADPTTPRNNTEQRSQ